MAVDRDSPTWRAVKAYCEAEIEVDRRNIEAEISHDTTMLIRGRIKALRNILALAETKPTIADSGIY